MSHASAQRRRSRHPLASLTAAEVEFATAAFAAAVAPADVTFYDVTLLEAFTTAQKEAALKGNLQLLPKRRARIIAAETRRGRVIEGEAPVDQSSSPIVILRELPDTQPTITSSEYELVERLVLEFEPFKEACRERGIDPADVRCDCWCVGWFDAADDPSRRLAMPILYLSRGDKQVDNLYMQPLEGFDFRLDLWSTPPSVICFDARPAVAAPPKPDPKLRFPNFAAEAKRPTLLPLRQSQPHGASFELGASDGVLRWQKWEAVVSFNAREGAVLSSVRFDGRPVAWRLSFAEMVVPYGDPHFPHYRKAAFDAGEDGLGRNATSLDPSRCDCVPGAEPRFLDAAIADEHGKAEPLPRAVCVHEEDGGLMWRHVDWRTGEAVTRRGRSLVVMWIATIANYTTPSATSLARRDPQRPADRN